MFNGFRSLGYLDNFNKPLPPVWLSATGGAETTYSASGMTYKVHTFTTSSIGVFEVTELGSSGTAIDAILVAGGGGSSDYSGGGGAGGMLQWTAKPITVGTYNIIVGLGGSANSLGLATGNGGDSRINYSNGSMFGGGYALGGGAGGYYGAGGNYNGQSGGSGGGAAANSNGTAYGGNGITGQGYWGGNAAYQDSAKDRVSAGGGGAGGAPPGFYISGFTWDGFPIYANAPTPGVGLASSITGTSVTYARGGDASLSTASTANTGNGANSGGTGKSGADGIIIIRYRIA